METDNRTAGFGVFQSPTVWIFNHQVGIYRQSGSVQHRRGGWQSPCQIGHKVVIHNVEVNPVGALDVLQRLGEMHLVAVQHGGVNLKAHIGSLLSSIV